MPEPLSPSGQAETLPRPTPPFTCAHCGPLPDDERLDLLRCVPLEWVHSLLVREARGWESYFGPEPAEYEPCGPVTGPTPNDQ